MGCCQAHDTEHEKQNEEPSKGKSNKIVIMNICVYFEFK